MDRPDEIFCRLGHAGLYNLAREDGGSFPHADLVTTLLERGGYARTDDGSNVVGDAAWRALSEAWRRESWSGPLVVPPSALRACLRESARWLCANEPRHAELFAGWLATAERRSDVWATVELPGASSRATVVVAYWTEPPSFVARASTPPVDAVSAARTLVEDLYLDIDNLFSQFVFEHGHYTTPKGQLHKLAFVHFLDSLATGDVCRDARLAPLLRRILRSDPSPDRRPERLACGRLLFRGGGFAGMTGQPDLPSAPALYLIVNPRRGEPDDLQTATILRGLATVEPLSQRLRALAGVVERAVVEPGGLEPPRAEGAPQVTTFALPREPSSALGARLAAVATSPYLDFEAFQLRAHSIVAAHVAGPLLTAVHELRYRRTMSVALFVRGLPTDSALPPTPLDGRAPRGKRTFVSEGVLVGFGRLLGEPFGFAAEKDGVIIHNVAPVPSRKLARSNEGSLQNFDLHTEIAFHPLRPHHLLLYCLRADSHGDAATTVVDVLSAIRGLGAGDLACLREPRFELGAPESFGARAQPERRRVPVLSGHEAWPTVCLNFNVMEATDPRSRDALRSLEALLNEHTVSVRLRAGDLLLVDNRRAVHGRTPFQARFDGSDRWLQRLYVRERLWQDAAGLLSWPARTLPD